MTKQVVLNAGLGLACAALALVATPATAAPGDMSIAAFLAKADALKAKGPMALFSGDIKVLQTEGQAGGLTAHSSRPSAKPGTPAAARPKPSKCHPTRCWRKCAHIP